MKYIVYPALKRAQPYNKDEVFNRMPKATAAGFNFPGKSRQEVFEEAWT